MSNFEKFGTARFLPPGKWVQATPLVSVAGVNYRPDAVQAFLAAVRAAEKAGLQYGVGIVPEPTNPHDANAIMVVGWAQAKQFLRGVKQSNWHIGYLDRDTAEFVSLNLLPRNTDFTAQLYSIYVGIEDFIDIKLFVMAPPGNSYGALRRS